MHGPMQDHPPQKKVTTMNLNHTVSLITGAASGIGLGIARRQQCGQRRETRETDHRPTPGVK